MSQGGPSNEHREKMLKYVESFNNEGWAADMLEIATLRVFKFFGYPVEEGSLERSTVRYDEQAGKIVHSNPVRSPRP